MSSPTDIFRDSVYSVLNSVHTALPGIVKSYDPTTNKATVQPALNKKYVTGPMPMPILENVPVMFSGGTNFNITFPISEGDYVLLIFIERSIDLWLSVGGQVTPDDPRKFDLSDAIAIPGLQPFTGDFSQRNNNEFVISFAGSEIVIQANGDIQIKTGNKVAIGNQTTELLQQIIDLCNSIAVNVISGPGPYPDLAADATQISVALELIKGTIT